MKDDLPRLHITSTFSAEPLAEPLSFWTTAMGWPWRVTFAGYQQVFQELLDPASELSTNKRGANLLLIRLGEFGEPKAMAAELVDAWNAQSDRWFVPLIVCVCPGRSDGSTEMEAARILTEAAEALHDIHVMSFEKARTLYQVQDLFDTDAETLASIPYTTGVYAALATMVVRLTSSLQRKPRKVIALDCDNTLWGGIVGEDGPLGIDVSGIYSWLQTFMLARREEGFLLCLCSKNIEADVEAVFTQHRLMPLKPDHITARKIGWNSKSSSIVELGQELGLHPDSFILVDDNPLECAEVTSVLPGTLVIRLPDDKEAIPDFLNHVWAFDRGNVTAADRRRAAMYGEAVLREGSRKKANTLAEFLDGLALKIDVHPLGQDELTRASQLTQRTNQFNINAIRRSSSEIHRFIDDADKGGLAVNVEDRFGDYGFVGLALYHILDGVLDVDTFLLSCRALGRGVEHCMLAQLASIGLEAGCTHLSLTHVQTSQNAPARQLLFVVAGDDDLFTRQEGDAVLTSALLPCNTLASLRYRPGESDEALASPSPATVVSTPSTHAVDWLDDNAVASRFTHADAIVEAMRQHQRGRSVCKAGNDQDRPQGALEQAIADIWCETLLLDAIGREDDFFAFGGTSLKAIQAIARLRRQFGVDLSVEAFFEAPTVRQLALILENLLSNVITGEI